MTEIRLSLVPLIAISFVLGSSIILELCESRCFLYCPNVVGDVLAENRPLI